MKDMLTLKLNSPVGASPITLNVKKGYEGAKEIIDIITWACRDIPDLQVTLSRNILQSVDVHNFDTVEVLCKKYNKAIDAVLALEKGTQKFVDRLNKRASKDLLRHILQQTYNTAVTNAEELNKYQAFSPDVYGETSYELICQMMEQVRLTAEDVFVDLGSGVGQVILQVAATSCCKKCIGIERAAVPNKYAVSMREKFEFWMNWYGKLRGRYELIDGDFLNAKYRDVITSATVLFVNNFAFGPSVDHQLKELFAELSDGTKIISSKSFCPTNFRITDRNLSDIGTIMNVTEIRPKGRSVSWTDKPVTFYVHVIDRTKLEEYFRKRKENGYENQTVFINAEEFVIGSPIYITEPKGRPKSRGRKRKRHNVKTKLPRDLTLEKLLDLFRTQYTEMTETMKSPLYRLDVKKQLEDEVKKNVYLKGKAKEIEGQIEDIIERMRQAIDARTIP